MAQEQPHVYSDEENRAYAEAAASWKRKLDSHAAAFPDHEVKRDPTMGGHSYCRHCSQYVTL